MDVNITGFRALIQKIDLTDLKFLLHKHLCIDYQMLKRSVVSNSQIKLEHYPADEVKPSVIITTLSEIDSKDCNVLLELKRPYFAAVDPSHVNPTVQQFELGKLLRFLSRYKYTIKQLDLAYLDADKCLSEREILHWCTYSKEYCVGTLVKWRIPEIVTKKNGDVVSQRRIKLGTSDSKSNYGVISIAPKTGRVSVALKVRKKQKIHYVLRDYGNYIQQQQDFQTRCRALLVSCIDLVTPNSKKLRIRAGYKRQPSYAAFLGQQGRIEAINWSRIYSTHT